MDTLKRISENLQNGDAAKVAELVQRGLDEGLSWEVILDKGLSAGMGVIGRLFKEEEIFNIKAICYIRRSYNIFNINI